MYSEYNIKQNHCIFSGVFFILIFLLVGKIGITGNLNFRIQDGFIIVKWNFTGANQLWM